MLGCSKSNRNTENMDNLVEIKLTSGVTASKVAFDPSSPVSGLVFRRHDIDPAQIGSLTYAGAPLLPANRAANGDITFGGSQYYNENENLSTYFVSYYPQGTNSMPMDAVTWDIDGKTDIIWAHSINSGNNQTPIQATVEYKHQLAMIEIICKADELSAQDRWGKIVGIKMKNTQPQIYLDLKRDATPVTQGTPTDITLWDKDFNAYQPLTLAVGNDQVQARGMFAPSGSKIEMIVSTQRTTGLPVDRNVEFNIPSGERFKAGFKYCLTFTFMGAPAEPEIVITSTITPWVAGQQGEIPVD